MSELQVVVVTPERTAVDEKAEFAVVPFFDGEKGIGINHTPFIAKLGYGELRLRSGGNSSRYYVDAGFVQVQDNRVVVLTENVAAVDEIDVDRARRQLADASQVQPTTDDEFAERDRLVEQARAMMHVAGQNR